MYNPYNWTINKKEEFSKSKPNDCVLNELCYTCNELDMVKLRKNRLMKELEDIERNLVILEDRKFSLIKQLADHP